MRGNYKHGLRGKRIYVIWKHMRQRCSNPNDIGYDIYGGRGISICEEWNDPKKFAKWAYSNGYADNLTIDRIDVNGDYCPQNCRWVTYKVQCNNKRNNVFYDLDGEVHTLGEWSDIVGIPISTIWARINRYGWSVEKALKTPIQKNTHIDASKAQLRTSNDYSLRFKAARG